VNRNALDGDYLAQHRADLLKAFLLVQGDQQAEQAILSDAARFDSQHPSRPSLVTQLLDAARQARESGGAS
jgi:hypothetical protein